MFFNTAIASSLVSTLALLLSKGRGNGSIPKVGQHLDRVPLQPSSSLTRNTISRLPHRNLSVLKNDATTTESAGSNLLVGRPVKQEKYIALLAWLKANGATINECLEIRPSSQGEQAGYGAFVKRPIERDELLFSIPRSLCVTIEKATYSVDDGGILGDALQALIEKAGPGGITVAMAAYLAKDYILTCLEDDREVGESEKNSSRWGPYLALLPWKRGINNQEHILFWNDQKIEGLLRGSLCYREAKSLREEVALSIKVLGPALKRSVRVARGEETATTNALERLSSLLPWQRSKQVGDTSDSIDDKLVADAIKGAFVTLLTRSFQDDESSEEDGCEKLVPLLDLLQHSDTPNVRHNVVSNENSEYEDFAVEVRARLDIPAGSELWNQYRSEEDEAMPYSRFFTRFGFVPGINEPIENLLLDKSTIFYPQQAEI
uniref:SET domain-containing protein n=1 Tax=Pseudo-nitzschia australis TaxID=44445 RepID=A0A7S4EKT8_9STRA|mmetsp:Transcript_5011/g.11147  ORF Transcript_5011/g.11147 Transcript_5011/m.11147 type:complete len:434 (+) Transcript_5011:90-1391(+)